MTLLFSVVCLNLMVCMHKMEIILYSYTFIGAPFSLKELTPEHTEIQKGVYKPLPLGEVIQTLALEKTELEKM